VAAQPDLATWGKPAEIVMAVMALVRHEKGGVRKIVFGGDFTQQPVI
jgi:hypothetical protein